MVVSIVMLTASVLPHHHHREILCLQHDVEACECASHCEGNHHEHHQHTGHCSHSHHACGSDCITHFQTLTPEKASVDVSPDYSFCALLYTLADLLSIPLPLNDTRANLSYFYLEKLHSTCLWHVQGLRAPPSFVLAWFYDAIFLAPYLFHWTITIKLHTYHEENFLYGSHGIVSLRLLLKSFRS